MKDSSSSTATTTTTTNPTTTSTTTTTSTATTSAIITEKRTAPGIPLPNYTAALTIPSFDDENNNDIHDYHDIPEPLTTPIRHHYLKPNVRSHPYLSSRKGDLLNTVLRETYKLSVSLQDLHRKIDTLLSEYQKVSGSRLDPKEHYPKFPSPFKDCDSDSGSHSGYNSSATENCDDSKKPSLKETSIGFLIN